VVRLALPILALTLGAALAVGLVSCGGRDDKGLLPGENAQQIVDNLNQVELEAENGDCGSAAEAAAEVQAQIGELGSDVNAQLRQRLAEGAAQLEQVISTNCVEATTTPHVEETTDTTTTEETTTDKGRTDTTTTDTTTTTTPTDTTAPTTPTGPPTGGTPGAGGVAPPDQSGNGQGSG
jgi:hypothetical protein